MGSPTCPTCGGRTIFTTRPCGGDEWNEYYRGADCRDPFHPWNNGPDVGDDDPACVCAHLGRSSCDKHAPTSDLPRPIGNTPPAPADDATRHESASAEAMREACAKVCEENGVVTTPQGKRLAPDRYKPTGAVHEGMVYAAAIRAIPLPARDDAVEDAASVERAASKWIASEVDAYPGTTMDDRIASWMRGGVHPDDVSRFLVDAYVEGYRAALARPRETTDAEAVRHAAAEIARAGAVAAYEAMAAAPRDGAQQYTRADVMEAVGDSLSKCESMIRALPLPARDDAVVEARALEDRIVDLRLTLAHIAHGGVLRDPEDGGVETAIRWADNALKADDKADDAAERGASVADNTAPRGAREVERG